MGGGRPTNQVEDCTSPAEHALGAEQRGWLGATHQQRRVRFACPRARTRKYAALTRCRPQAAVGAYGGQDWRLWLRYLQWEQQRGKGAGEVYWRAVKALVDPEPFITECQLQKLQ